METQHWTVTGARTLDVDGVSALHAAINRGRLDIITHDEPTTRIEVSELSGESLEITVDNGVLSIGRPEQTGWLGMVGLTSQRAVVSIAVPAGIDVRASTVSGDGLVCGTSKTTSLKTVSGSIMADDTEGALQMDAVSGEIIARFHSGPLVAKSVSGELTASGFLSDIRATTVSGDLSFDLLGDCRDIVSTSVSGDVSIRVPYGTGIELDAKTTSGAVMLGEQRFTGTAQTVHTTVGPQESPLRIRSGSVSGTISVVHRSERPVRAEGAVK
jgi:hypothetical protein